MILLLIGVVGLASVGVLIAMYNGLVVTRNNVEKSFKNIDVVLQQRNDELRKLIDTVKAHMTYEKDLLTRVTELRSGYAAARDVRDKIAIDNQLGPLLPQLQLVCEQYPELKAVQSFLQAQAQVSSLESKIADYREAFNDAVNVYNIQIERFPDQLLAKAIGCQRHAFLVVPEEKKQDVQMNFS